MAMRVSGLMSGLDTDAMVQDLIAVASTKKDSITKEQTKLGWKQTAWKELNTKVNTFFSKTLSNMRFEGSYSKKATTISDTSIASIVAGDSAVNGTQTLSVQSLAKAGYLTGGKLTGTTGGDAVTGKTTLAQMGIADGSSVNVTVGGKTSTLEFNGSTTIDQVVSSLKTAGVEASWDNTNKRLFINVDKSGASNDFTLAATNTNGQNLLTKLKLVDTSEAATYKGITSASPTYAALLAQEKATLVTSYTNRLSDAQDTVTSLTDSLDTLTTTKDAVVASMKTKYASTTDFDLADLDSSSTIDNAITDVQALIDAQTATLTASGKTAEEIAADQTIIDLTAVKTDIQATKSYYTQMANTQTAITTAQSQATTYQNAINDVGGVLTTEATAALQAKIDAADAGTYADTNDATKAVRVLGSDAQISLNGAVFTSADNSFTVNGLTITALETSDKNTDGSYVQSSINTDYDVAGVYDVIKGFFKEYNSLINEMTNLYNADSASGYEPLTTEEKDAMSDSEVELWEKKIKDSLLSKDSNLNSVMNLMKNSTMAAIEVDGTDYNLASFGIETLSYFIAAEDERNAYHIDGNSEDTNTSTKTDKLKTALANDPTTVATFFAKLTGDLYDKLNTTMKSNANRSVYNVYDDKKMKSDYDDYTDEIATQQEKVDAMEERYYAQFSAMETALAKLQNNSSALSSILS